MSYNVDELIERFHEGGTLDTDELTAIQEAGRMDEIEGNSSSMHRERLCDDCDAPPVDCVCGRY